MTSFFGLPKVFAYSTAKSAYLGMVRSLAVDLSPKGIRVNAIAPGFIKTAISRKAMAGDPLRKQKVLSRTPMSRFGVPEDVSRLLSISPRPRPASSTVSCCPSMEVC